MSVVLNSTTFKTLLPDGTQLRSVTYAGTSIDKNSIGEYHRIDFDLSLPTTTADRDFFFVPGIWANDGGYPSYGYKPTTAWKYSTIGAPTTGVEYDMNLIVASGYTPPASKNIRATITFVTGTNYIIKLYHYLIWDEHSFLLPSYQDNHSKWLKSSRLDTAELNTLAEATSGYGLASAYIQTYHYVAENNVIPPARPTVDVLASRYLYRAGWYYKHPANATPYFTAPEFILSRASGTVTNLSGVEDTKLTFRIGSNGSAATKVLVHLIRTDTTDNTIDYVTNYEDSFADVVTTGGTSTIDNKFKAPATGPAAVTGKIQVDIKVDCTLLNYGEKYRFMAVVYRDAQGVFEVNSFMSEEEYVVDDLPNYKGDGLDFTGTLADCDTEYTGNDLVCVVEERMRAKIVLDFAANKWADDILARLGLTVPNDIRRYLTKVTCEAYEENTVGATTTRHVFDIPIANKLSPVTYSAAPGITLDFATADQATFTYDFRNRYEAHLPNLYTYVNGVLLTSPTSTMNWAGKVINIEWTLEFFYDDYSTPFTDLITFKHVVRPKDYEYTTYYIQPEGQAEKDEDTPDDPDFYCSDEALCFQARITDGSSGYKLITTVEVNPGNANSISEEEVWVPGQLAQLTTPKIESQEENFSETEADVAKFCLEPDELLVNLQYKISAIAKRSNTEELLTEDDQEILTEGDDPIITE